MTNTLTTNPNDLPPLKPGENAEIFKTALNVSHHCFESVPDVYVAKLTIIAVGRGTEGHRGHIPDRQVAQVQGEGATALEAINNAFTKAATNNPKVEALIPGIAGTQGLLGGEQR